MVTACLKSDADLGRVQCPCRVEIAEIRVKTGSV